MHPEEQHRDQPKEYRELPVANLSPKRKGSPLAKLAILVVILVIALGGWLVLGRHKKPAPAKTTQTATSASITHITSTTKRYDSMNLYLGFYYPTDWTINDSGNDTLTATSPMLKLKSAGSQTENARIVLTIQNSPPSSMPQFAHNSAIAPLASQKITYKHPTANQRAQSYITPVNYEGSSATIDAIYVTGDNGYTEGQYVPGSDIVKASPLISLSFFSCNDAKCSKYTQPTSVATNAWADRSFSGPLIGILRSLEVD